MHRFKTWQLFAICVLVWSTTWHVITWQLADVAGEVGVALRFALAGAAVLALSHWRGEKLAFGARDHAALALQGVFLYGVSYTCVYYAERYVPSGLVAVGYSASPLLAGIGAATLFNASLERRFLAGGLLGLAGVALIFWPEIARPTGNPSAGLGATLTVASVLLSSIGSLAASRNRQRGVPLLPAMGFGMLYGAAAAALVAVALGHSFVPPAAARWWLALAYLAFAGSVLTFACFLTIQDRVGAGAAGTIGVMTPLLALLVSLGFESFQPTLSTGAGALLAVAGNALMLRRASPRPAAPAGAVPATE